MSTIPPQFQISELLYQDTYLVNGVLKKWKGTFTDVYSTISSSDEYKPTLLGSIPAMGETEADEVTKAAFDAYDNGQGLWPTMKVIDRIKCMQDFEKEV